MTLRKLRAFTLLELIVTIVILAILAALAIPTFAQVVSKSKLETAEVTIGSLAREAVALKALGQEGLFTEETVMAAVGDLPLVEAATSGLWAADAPEWKVLLGKTEFSTNSNILSVGIGGTPLGTDLGVAVYVPGAGCAYGLASGTQVQAWSVLGAPVELCSGIVALGGPNSGISAPPAPGGLTLSMGECAPGISGVIIDWAGAEFAEVFVNGESLGSFGPGTCHPGLTLNDVITVQQGGGGGTVEPGDGSEDPEDAGTSIGGVLAGEVVEIRWDKELVENPTGLTIIRNGEPLPGPYGNGVHYDPIGIPGDYIYEIEEERADGTKVKHPAGLWIIEPPAEISEEAPAFAAANGNTIRVQWGAVPDTTSAPLGGYKVYHARSSTAVEWEMIKDMPTPVAATYYDHAQLALGYHCYYVIAYGPGGNSERSQVSCASVEISATPKGMALAAISPASEHTCAIGATNSKVYCWGWANGGRLGSIPGTQTQTRPLEMPTAGNALDGKVVSRIATGGDSSCVIAEGEVICWGGSAGAGTVGGIPTKINMNAVPALDKSSFTALDVSAGASCAVSNGNAYCWGASYMLGANTTTSSTAAVPVTKAVGVLAGKTVTDIAVGSGHACAIANGSVYCWGSASTGAIGNGTAPSTQFTPAKALDVAGGFTNADIVDISAGSGFICAVNTSGKVYCWGKGGQLGNPSATTNALLAVEVDTSGALNNEKVTSLESNVNNTCATTESGKVVCWSSTPKAIDFPNVDASTSVRGLSLGGTTSCALTGDGTYCWGSNTWGQFGDGTIVSKPLPSPVNP